METNGSHSALGCLFSSFSSQRSWRDFARECFCFGSEAVNTSGEVVRGLVKSNFTRGLRQGGNMAALPLARSRIPPATQATLSAIAPGRSKSPYHSPLYFPAQRFFRLLPPCRCRRKQTQPFFRFSKAFEPMLRRVLGDKMTPLYLVICFVTC